MYGRMLRWLIGVGVLAFICAAILIYGYWRAISRGYIYLNLVDISNSDKPQPVFNAELILHNAVQEVLAKGKSDARLGIVRFIHPQFGSCEEEEKAATTSAEGRPLWDKCISAMFRWQSEWAPRVASLDIRFAGCDVKNIPLTLRESRDDWWLWWVPLPHIGGDPFTYFSTTVTVDAGTCEARALGG